MKHSVKQRILSMVLAVTLVLGGAALPVQATEGSGDATDYNITIGAMENGTVTADKSKAAAGEVVTLTVTPVSGYELDTLTVTGESEQQSGCDLLRSNAH